MSIDETPVLPAQVSPPEFALSALRPHEIGQVECLAYPVSPDGDSVAPGPGLDAAAQALGVDLLGLLVSAKASGRTGAVTSVPVMAGETRMVLAVGVGDGSETDLRRAGAALARAVKGRSSVALALPEACAPAHVTALVVGAMLGSFEFKWRSEEVSEPPVPRVVLSGAESPELTAALERGVVLGGAGWRSRLLATVPSNVKNPEWLAAQAVEVAGSAGLDVEVWDEQVGGQAVLGRQ